AVYYAHAGAGELHLRPLIDLKSESDRIKLRQICEASAQLVKKYKGSLSGEHGDGRVRAEFIPLMVGESNYNRFKRVKQIWDPNGIFNPGKIVDAPPMDEDLRYEVETEEAAIDSFLDFSDNQGLLQAVEKCNGSADCRKITGAMCPTYQATKNEKTTTRARANILREVLTENSKSTLPLADEGLKEVLDLCVSCKACKRECPSNVDMSLMKAEFLYQYNEKNGISLKDKIIANLPELNKRSIPISRLVNFAMNNSLTARFIKQFLGVHSKRNLPPLNSISFEKWLIQTKPLTRNPYKTVYLFIDEFTNFNDLEIGQITVSLLFRMGYEVLWVSNAFSGRTYISKGHLQKAKDVAEKNVEVYRDLITPETPLIGIEPSAILTFRDEYPKLLEGKAKKEAQNIATNTFTIEEFIFNQSKERDLKQFFHEDEKKVKAHVHCHQKALSDKSMTASILSIPKNYSCTIVNGGCCGMAGSFGYEKDKFELSKQMAELHLIPTVNNASSDTIIAASGTSCRHQIDDLSTRTALHPIEVLYNALK
ncbi:MAG: 4Fe-4S dicluster domain-containing protein, partial [Schleiferiaceae bacterium]|nr:4Fe-4S dicluster domain-containing protein [Schleiferiaceae bacterium]